MILVLLIGFLVCFVCGLLLGFVLLQTDATSLRHNGSEYFWEATVALLFNICQAGLSAAGIAAIAIAFNADIEPYWLDGVILCTLQLLVGANLARTLRTFKAPRWAIWLAYGGTVLTALDISFCMRDQPMCSVYGFGLLSRAAIASLIALAFWYPPLGNHTRSGQRNPGFVHLLRWCIAVNAAAAICETGGAVVLYGLLLANREISTVCPSLFLVCVLVQEVHGFAFSMAGMRRMFKAMGRWTRTGNDERAVRLNSR